MVGLIIFLLIVIAIITGLRKSVANNPGLSKGLGAARVLALIGILIAVIFSAIVQVGPGEVGVQVLFGSVQDGVLHSGLNFVNPLINVEKLDVRTQAYTM